MPKPKGPVMYLLVLDGDIQSTPGSVILETGEASLDKDSLKPFLDKRNKDLDEYFGDDEEEEGDVCYCNYDLDSRPTWSIQEIPLIK
jgi:hypothetical protein